MKNADLKPIYDSQQLEFHPGYNESRMIADMIDDWRGLEVLEIGCGHGHLASLLTYAGANVIGVDFSDEQIKIAQELYPSVTFLQSSTSSLRQNIADTFDVVVLQGVLEHLDEPWDELDGIMEKMLSPTGCVCLSVPHWVNPRGYIYHTLRLLFDAKMSLTDLHWFLPGDFVKYCGDKRLCQFYHCDESWAAGPEMIADFKERLPKALFGFSDDEHIAAFLAYLKRMLPDIHGAQGACLGVKISK